MSSKLVKYNEVQKVEGDGRSFDSKSEMKMYSLLRDREKLGEISELECQVGVTLLDGPVGYRRRYKCDFRYRDKKSGELIYLEVKGFETERWLSNLLLWRHLGPGRLLVFKSSWGKFELKEEVRPNYQYIIEKIRKIQEGLNEE